MIPFFRPLDAVSMSIGVPCVISTFNRPLYESKSSASVKRSSNR